MNTTKKRPALVGFAAWSGTGKTTLLEKVIPLLGDKGHHIAVIKHAHHNFDIDHDGKDSFKLRKAGVIDTIVASAKRWAYIHENQAFDNHIEDGGTTPHEPDLNTLLALLHTDPNRPWPDIILVEGFKHACFPRIELHRAELNKPLLYPVDKEIIAIATNSNDKMQHPIKTLDINNPAEIAAFIETHFLPG